MKRTFVAVVALGLALTACGGDSTSTPAGTPTAAGGDTGSTATADMTPTGDVTATGDATPTAGETVGECTPDSMQTHEAGVLTVATGEPVFEPWMVDDDPTNGQGYESAFVYALAGQLGFAEGDVTWVRTGFDEAIAPGDKPYDFNIQQYTITEERDEVVDFTVPYYVAQRTVVALEGSPADGATTFEDLQAATWGATQGTFDLDYIEDEIGISDVAVYDSQADTLAAMNAGQIDATVVNLPTAYFLTATQVEDGVIAGVLPGEGENADEFGLLLDEGSPLKECLDQAITALRDDGTLEGLADEWLTGSGDIPAITP